MIRAGVGSSTLSNPRKAALEATAAALAQAQLRVAECALVFATTGFGAAYHMILNTVAEAARTREVAGCGARGVIAGGREIETGAALAVMVIGGSSIAARRLFVPQLRGRSREAAAAIASTVRPHLDRNNLLCLFPDSYNVAPEPLLETLAGELPGVPVIGGGATEDGSVGETFQFCGDVVSSNAVSGMLLTGDLALNLGTANACAPLGPTHRVTAVRDNVILGLDGRRAWDVLAETIGPLAADLPRALGLVFAGIPQARGAERIGRGDFFVRNITGASPEHGAIAVAHRLRHGDTLGFVLRDGERSRTELKSTLAEMAERSTRAPAFGLYFDCVSRGVGLYGMPDHDSAYIGRQFGAVPIAGFFTGFEFGPLGADTGLLQYCGVLALVSDNSH